MKNLLSATALLTLSLSAAAQVPGQLPGPGPEPGDATKPVQVYILAGQSNMVGMGDIAGAQNRYTGVFLTPDPAAPKGPLGIYKVGNYRVRPLGVYTSPEPDAAAGAIASLDGSSDATLQVKIKQVPHYGTVTGQLPTFGAASTLVVRTFLEVPESGRYTIHTGYGASAHNVARLDGQEVYRRDPGGAATTQAVALEAGRRHALEVTYFEGGSTAVWMSQEDLLGKGDLETVVKRNGKFPYLIDGESNWTVRQDVRYQEARLAKDGTGSMLTATSNGKTIGPELAFGHVLGTFHEEAVLLIKTAQGNRSLGFDFRPPSSGRTDPDSEWESLEYTLMIEGVRKTLARLDEIVPGYQGQGYELAGFAWWQGHKDGGTPEHVAQYEQHLIHLIQDVRAEFKVPDLPIVIATIGFNGHAMSDTHLKILEAQMAVGDPELHPELAGTVSSVDTRDFWREVDESPRDQGHHYHRNAETYLLVGDALGRAMVRLRGGEAEVFPQAIQPRTIAQGPSPGAAAPDEAAAQAALAPMIMDGVAPAYIANPRNNPQLLSEARGERPQRSSQFLRAAMYGLRNIYRTVGLDDHDWHTFGPDLKRVEWEYFSFDPPETRPKEKGGRYRVVTWPDGMEDWFAPGFDAIGAGWKTGLPPFGQLDGELAPLSKSCTAPFCLCSETPKTLWEREVLMLRGTFELPKLEDGKRYRIVVGGSAHVNAGEGFSIYVNGKLLCESTAGVGKRQGGQPRGAPVYADFRDEFQGGEVTIAVHSFLRYNYPRGPLPPRGHLMVWVEEANIPLVDEVTTDGR